MTIDEAIKELRKRRDHWADMNDRDGVESAQLGIEALKVMAEFRAVYGTDTLGLLPGETES